MRGLILAFAILAGHNVFAARHAVSQFMFDGLTEANRILQLQDGDQRMGQMCNLLRSKIDTDGLGNRWLGEFAELERDQAAAAEFIQRTPDVLIHKIFGSIKGQGNTGPQEFEVSEDVEDNGDGQFAVDVTFITDAGNRYTGTAVVLEQNGALQLYDVVYFGYSAVEYQGQEFQDLMMAEFNKDEANSMPITALLQSLRDNGMDNCP